MQLLALVSCSTGRGRDAPGSMDGFRGGALPDLMPCEVLICEMRAYKAGQVLEVQPPFQGPDAGGSFPYRFQVPGGGWFEYTLENVSGAPTQEERASVLDTRRAFEAAVPRMRRSIAGIGFEPFTEDSEVELALTGEIVSFQPDAAGGPAWAGEAHDGSSWHPGVDGSLDTEAIFRWSRAPSLLSVLWRPCFYAVCEVSLPAGGEWALLPGGSFSSASLPVCTQFASLSGCFAHQEHCIFNQPIEVHLAQRGAAELQSEECDPVPPRLVLQVLRVDTWSRHSLHGYAFVDVPQHAGALEVQAQLWVPVTTIRQQLNAEFCGSYVPLFSPALVAAADVHRRDGLPRNRSSLRADTSAGVLRLRLHVSRRHRSQAPEAQRPRWSAEDFKAAFQRGRQLGTAGLRRRRPRGSLSPTLATLAPAPANAPSFVAPSSPPPPAAPPIGAAATGGYR